MIKTALAKLLTVKTTAITGAPPSTTAASKELADKAGGKDRDKADRFCDDLLRRWPSATPIPRPDGKSDGTHGSAPPTRPSDRPDSDKPGDGPGGEPGDDQTSKPPARPDGSLPPKEKR